MFTKYKFNKLLMKKSFLILIGIACLFTIYSCRNSVPENKDQEVLESKPTEIKERETSTLFLPIGGYTPGFMYCGFDGDKVSFDENDGWQIVSINSQIFNLKKVM